MSKAKNNVEETMDYDLLLAEEALVVDVLEDLLEALEQRGMSQADLAKKLGVSRAAVNRVLRGRNLTVRTVARFAHSMGVKVRLQVMKDMGCASLAQAYSASSNRSSLDAFRASPNNIYIFQREAAA